MIVKDAEYHRSEIVRLAENVAKLAREDADYDLIGVEANRLRAAARVYGDWVECRRMEDGA
jgi:hypothetical protein